MPTLNALHDSIIIQPDKRPEKTASGLIIPETVKDEPMIGTVVSVGPGISVPGKPRKRPAVDEGDRVLFGKWSGESLEYEGIDYKIMYEKDIFGVVNKT